MTYVYRAYAEDDRLLYVGMTDDVGQRLKAHGYSGAAWLTEMAYHTVESYPDRDSAHIAEVEAIISESPLYNVQPGRARPRRKHQPHSKIAREIKPDPRLREAIKREAEADPPLSADQRARLAVLLLNPIAEGGDHESG
jgi:hypothetical protein